MKKYILYTIILFLIGISVKAQSYIEDQIENNGYYVNNRGVKITEENYEKIKDNFLEEELADMHQGLYNKIDKISTINITNSSIIKNTYYESQGKAILIKQEEVTEEEYYEEINIPVPLESCGYGCWKTEYKRIRLIYGIQNGQKNFYISNTWLKKPVIQSYDIIAMRWTGNVTRGEVYGTQDFLQNGVIKTIEYPQTLQNVYYNSIGAGISQNLVDDATDYFNSLDVNITCSGVVNLYGTYQHAVEDISLSDSLKYTFGSSGMGGVLVFGNTSIANKYDNTQGLHISFTC